MKNPDGESVAMKIEKLLFERFVTAINRYGMVCDGDMVLVALSGGADSVALLYLMLDLRSIFDIDICAAHLNHSLRGKEANEDERFVKDLCRRLEVRCLTAKIDIAKKARTEKKNIEAAAREARISFLKDAARKLKVTKIAVGHTMNDQAENIIFRLLRGSGARGLSSMKAVQGNIIRPLLWIEREKIEAYLLARNLPFRLDSSNSDLRFTRNRIRHILIPLLKRDYNPQIISTLARTAELLSDEDSFLDSLASEILGRDSDIQDKRMTLSAELIRSIPPALARRVLRCAVRMVQGELKETQFGNVEKILTLVIKRASGKTVLLPSYARVTITAQKIVITAGIPSAHIRKAIQKRLNIEGTTEIDQGRALIRSTIVLAREFQGSLKEGGKKRAFLDLKKTGKILSIRSVAQGDSFRPLNAPGRKKVSDFFIDRKVPKAEREDALVVTSKGRITWLVGHEIDDRFKVGAGTGHILILELKQP